MAEKVCPLRLLKPSEVSEYAAAHCLEDKCAWWHKNNAMCAVLITGISLSGLYAIYFNSKKESTNTGAG